jgi:hypothetical protein
MPEWTPDDRFRFDLSFALKKVAVRGLRRILVEQERVRIADTIFDHLRLCGWRWSKAGSPDADAAKPAPARADGPGTG